MMTSSHAQSNNSLLRLVPGSANVLLRVNVQAILDSPVARREGWEKKQEAKAREGLALPVDSIELLQASKVDWTNNMKSLWDLSLVTLSHQPSMSAIARVEGGYADEIEGVAAAYSPRGAFFINVAPKTVAMMIPANRQEAAHWLTSIKTRTQPAISNQLQKGLVANSAPFTIICDTNNLLSRTQIRSRLRNASAMTGKTADFEQLSTVVASLKGLRLDVMVTNTIDATITIEFGQNAAPLRPFARELVLEAFENQGVSLPEFKDFRTVVGDNTITFAGRLTSSSSLSILSSFVAIPSGSLPTSTSESASTSAAADPRAATIRASKRYYDEITKLIDDLRSKSRSTAGYRLTVWTDRYALQIDRLPILNVDPDLLAYGTFVSESLRGVRNVKIQTRANEQFNRAAQFTGGGGFDEFGNGFYNDTGAGATVLRRQADSQITSNVNNIWTQLETQSAEIRKKLTLKYEVEF
jgi:hypothetical protein